MIIKGANGQIAEVLGRKLRTLSAVYEHLHEESLKGQVFVASSIDQASSLTGTAAVEELMYIKNNEPQRDLVIKELHFGASASLAFEIMRNPVAGTLGANTPGSPHCLNFGVTKLPAIQIEIWNEAAGGITGLSGGEPMQAIFNGVAEHNESYFDALILPPGTSLSIRKAATAAEVVVAATFTMMESGLLLLPQ